MAKPKKPSKPSPHTLIDKLRESIWFFPGILAIFLILLTLLRINGSSIGIYHSVFYGGSKDSNLLVNNPQAIRSDEWLVTTQLTIAQHVAGYPRINPNIDSGRDMSVVGDAPYKDWSTLFRPQNLSFFIMPFENAFAFKWWFLLYMVIISCYFFTLRIFPGRRLLATLFSSAIGLSPFLFWWYQTGTLGCLFYGFFIVILAMRIINGEKVRPLKNTQLRYSYLVYALAMSYLLVSFAFILYPPFQIPIAITVAIFTVGLFLERFGTRKLLKKESLLCLATFLAAVAISGMVILTFFHTRQNVVSAVTNTVYPGKRVVQTEGNSGYEIMSTFLQPQLQKTGRAAHYFTNQSEASNFVLFLPFLFVPGFIVLLAQYRQNRKLNWPLLAIQLCIALFLAYLFIPWPKLLYKLFALNKVANVRLFIGLGFAGAIQLLLIVRSLDGLKINKQRLNLLSGIYVALCLAMLGWIGYYARVTYPQFIHYIPFIAFLALFFCAILFCFITRRAMLGATLFLMFSAGCVFKVHPLYRGLGEAYSGKVIQAMDQVSKPGDSWAAADSLYYENFGIIANRQDLSGVKPYPDLSFWRRVDGSKDDYVYNRYAHVLFNADLTKDFLLVGPDNFQVRLACTPFIEKNLDYALTNHPLNNPCMDKVREVRYPAITFYIYRIH